MSNNVFFTSDTHFYHRNILKFTNRTSFCSTIEEHDEELIKRWNSVVSKNDLIYHLGDFSFAKELNYFYDILTRLNGRKFWILGNHDHLDRFSNVILSEFEWIRDYYVIPQKQFGQHIVLFHYPMREWYQYYRGSWHLYGHVHGEINDFGKSMDVGIDAHEEFRPFSFEEVQKNLEKL